MRGHVYLSSQVLCQLLHLALSSAQTINVKGPGTVSLEKANSIKSDAKLVYEKLWKIERNAISRFTYDDAKSMRKMSLKGERRMVWIAKEIQRQNAKGTQLRATTKLNARKFTAAKANENAEQRNKRR